MKDATTGNRMNVSLEFFSKWQAILDTYNRIKCKGPLLYAGIVFLGNSMINRRFQEHFAFTHKPKLDFSFR